MFHFACLSSLNELRTPLEVALGDRLGHLWQKLALPTISAHSQNIPVPKISLAFALEKKSCIEKSLSKPLHKPDVLCIEQCDFTLGSRAALVIRLCKQHVMNDPCTFSVALFP